MTVGIECLDQLWGALISFSNVIRGLYETPCRISGGRCVQVQPERREDLRGKSFEPEDLLVESFRCWRAITLPISPEFSSLPAISRSFMLSDTVMTEGVYTGSCYRQVSGLRGRLQSLRLVVTDTIYASLLPL